MREILEIFNISKVGKVAGCRVTDGIVERGANVRLIRDNVVIHEGKLSTLKRFKDDVARSAVRPGMRHGIRELPGHAGRRRDRVLSRRDSAAHALSPIWLRRIVNRHARDSGASSNRWHAQSIARRRLDHPLSRTMTRSENTWPVTMHRDQRRRSLAAPASRRRTDPPRAGRDAGARRRARSGDRGAHDHRAGSAHVAGSAARDRLRHAARRARRRTTCSRRSIATSASCAARSRIALT